MSATAQYSVLFALVLGLLIDNHVESCNPNKFGSSPSPPPSPPEPGTTTFGFHEPFAAVFNEPGPQTMDRNDARSNCNSHDMNLASIRTTAEMENIKRSFQANQGILLNNKFWTSAKQSGTGFIWSDTNTPVDSAVIENLQPSAQIQDEFACGVFSINADGQSTLEARDCSEKRFGALCRERS